MTDLPDPTTLRLGDDEAKAVQHTRHRVTLDSMVTRIVDIEYIHPESIPHMTIAVVSVNNGFVLVGKSTPADEQNFDEELGKKYAYEDALRQMWPLEAYLLRERMTL